MMLQANPEINLKLPGRKMEAAKSERAKEIAKSREEMLSLLHDMPESDYELSLTDIVDNKSKDTQKEDQGIIDGEKISSKGKEKRRSNSGKSFRCSSDGVLLKFYTPASLTRSLTTPRGKPPTISRTNSVNCSKREKGRTLKFLGCWSLPWDQRWGKSKTLAPQDQNDFEFDKIEENSKSILSNSKSTMK